MWCSSLLLPGLTRLNVTLDASASGWAERFFCYNWSIPAYIPGSLVYGLHSRCFAHGALFGGLVVLAVTIPTCFHLFLTPQDGIGAGIGAWNWGFMISCGVTDRTLIAIEKCISCIV